MMHKNNKILNIVILSTIILTILFILRTFISTNDIKEYMVQHIKKEAKVVSNYILASRKAYQEEFLNNCYALDSRSLIFLPAHISNDISKKFLKLNNDGYSVKSVSDKPINPQNKADKEELKSIAYFKKDTTRTEYLEEFISNGVKYYQYSTPLLATQTCLTCHGDKQNAPDIIQKNYKNAYGYKLNEVRGIISIKIPKKIYSEALNNFVFKEILFSIISMIVISFVLYLLYKSTHIEITKIGKDATKIAHTDALTGLYNRHYLRKLVDNFNPLDREDCRFVVAFIDIDNFKNINDIYGHEVGDTALKTVAKRLLDLTRHNDIVCRYGGEEFLVIMRDISQDDAFEKMDIIRDIISKDIDSSTQKTITISIGISDGRKDDTLRDIIRQADKAMYIAKNTGKNCVKVFQKKVD